MQNAITAAILSSIVCGVIGVIIVEKKLIMMSGGIAHTSYGGVGMGFLFGFEPIIGAFIFSIAAALGIGFINKNGSGRTDVMIGLMWSLGMALGILFIALMPGYPPDLSTYLFGNILSVTKVDLYMMFGLTVIVTLVITVFYNNWKAYLFDSEFAHILGMPTALLEYILLILVAMTVVVLIRVVGIILVLALLTAPAATASIYTTNFKRRIIYSIILGIVFCLFGLGLSYELNIASGAAIVLLSVACYLFTYVIHFIRTKHVVKKVMKQSC